MAASNEYTEWYLTPSGWVRGSEKTDFDFTKRPEPEDALAKHEYTEYLGSHHSRMNSGTTMLWEKGERKEKIAELTAKFGPCPTKL